MTEPLDPLLRALGAVERDLDARYPADWERVVAGEADPAAVAAARAGLDPPAEHTVFSDMFSEPASDADIDALVARAAAALAAPAGDSARPGAGPGPAPPARTAGRAEAASVDQDRARVATAASARQEPAAGSDPATNDARVIPLASRRRAQTIAGVVLALAAAVTLWRFTAPPSSAALTGYTVTVRNSPLQELRGDEPAGPIARYRPDSELDWVISPERAVPEAVELRVLARAPDGRSELLAPPLSRSPAGALRIRGRLDAALPLAAGRWRLTLLVAPEGAAPGAADEVSAALAAGRAVEVAPPLEIEIVAAGP